MAPGPVRRFLLLFALLGGVVAAQGQNMMANSPGGGDVDYAMLNDPDLDGFLDDPDPTPILPGDPNIGPVWNVVSCYACGMRGDDALQRDWPPCEDEELKHSKIDACGGGRMRCYVMYGEYDWEIFGRKVISKGCTYATYFKFALNKRKRRKRDVPAIGGPGSTSDDDYEDEKPASGQQLARKKRHLGMIGRACGLISGQTLVYYDWNITHPLMPMCMCDDANNCNLHDDACMYDPNVCRNGSTPSPVRVRRGKNAATALNTPKKSLLTFFVSVLLPVVFVIATVTMDRV